MSPNLLAFAALAAITLGAGIGVVASRNVVYAALLLLVSLSAVAGIYILLLAEFLALVQLLIYGGAIIIVLLFAVMLTRAQEFAHVRDNPQWLLGLAAALAAFAGLAAAMVRFRPQTQALQPPGLQALGNELFTTWAVPFEVASLVLLVALVGAIIIARAGGRES
ncbi:MAG: NADH-quinone oxidoreductase subunit J [Chloroflexi bacterium]|nr:NADH-quinone oxidoreductase subunit J [Chloroflexota bacterium]